jgi:hypothetical protein
VPTPSRTPNDQRWQSSLADYGERHPSRVTAHWIPIVSRTPSLEAARVVEPLPHHEDDEGSTA